jgi:UDP-glucose 4-epimerase
MIVMKILITGGAGFIGSHIADALIENNRVVIIDNLSSGRLENLSQLKGNKNFKFINLDIRDKEKIDNLFLDEGFDCVFHLAAQINVRESVKNPREDAEVNLIGLLNILEACVKNKVKKFIFSSSGGAIYGDGVKIPTPETEKESPISPYGIAKLCSEKYLHYYNKQFGLDWTALRYSNVYGPRQNPKGEAGVVSIFINKILSGEQPVINGSGEQTRDYVYVEDVVSANILALKKNLNGIFNVGTGKEIDVNELFLEVVKLLGFDFKEIHGAGLAGEQMRSCLNFDKIKKFGWIPEYDLEKGLRKTVDWFKENN